MAQPRVFYFAGRPDCLFLKGLPSSHKGWKSLYLFTRLPNPLPYSDSWRIDLLDLPSIKECLLECSFETVRDILREHSYSLRILLDERLLYHFWLSPIVSDGLTLIGILLPSLSSYIVDVEKY